MSSARWHIAAIVYLLLLVSCGFGRGGGTTGLDRDFVPNVADSVEEATVEVAPRDEKPHDQGRDDHLQQAELTQDPGADVFVKPKGFEAIDLTAVGHVRSIWASPEAGIWAVGENGLVLRFNGREFVPLPSPPTQADLMAVAGEGAVVVAVGHAGTVVRWEDGAWQLLKPPADWEPYPDLHGVAVLARDDFYVAGKRGTIWHYKGDAFSAEPTGVTYDLYGIHASYAGGVFAVGTFGMLVELRAGHWVQSQIAAPDVTLRGIWRSPDGKMFAVGSKGAISMYDGLTWKLQLSNDPSDPPRDLYAVTGFSSEEVYAVGDRGAVLKYNGKKWTLMTVAGPYNISADLRGIGGLLNPDGSRVLFAAGLDSKGLRLRNNVWEDMALGITGRLNAVAMRKDGSVLIVGENGLLVQYAEGRFSTIPTGTDAELKGVSEHYAVGSGGVVMKIEGDKAQRVEVKVADDWNDVWEVGQVALLVGEKGNVLRIDTSAPWLLPTNFGVNLKGVCIAGGAAFVVGAEGKMFVDEGNGFHSVATWTYSTLWDVLPTVGRKVLAVGDHGVILSCDPTSCKRLHEDPTTFLYGLGRVSGGLALAVGWAGAVRWIGLGEEVFPLDPQVYKIFRGAAGLGLDGETYIVGPNATFLVYRP